MVGSTCSESLRDEAAQSSQAALSPQALPGFRSANGQLPTLTIAVVSLLGVGGCGCVNVYVYVYVRVCLRACLRFCLSSRRVAGSA